MPNDPAELFDQRIQENRKAWEDHLNLDQFEEVWRGVLNRPSPEPPPVIGLYTLATWELQAQEDARVFDILDSIVARGFPTVSTPPEVPSRFDRI